MSNQNVPGEIHRVEVPGWTDPALIRARLFGDADWQIWLDAGPNASTKGRPGRSYLGVGRSRVVTASASRDEVLERDLVSGLETAVSANIFDFLKHDLSRRQHRAPVVGSQSRFQLGWVGWLGYELASQTMGAVVADSDSGVPDACMIFLDRAVEFDHATGQVFALSIEPDELWCAEVSAAVVESIVASATERIGDTQVPSLVKSQWRFNRSEYEALIDVCLDQIRQGNAYQLCLTNRLELEFESSLDPFSIYSRLREANPAHHGGLIVADGVSLLSASPEVFLNITPDGLIRTKPIKGTRPRGSDAKRDEELSRELRADDKERAENLMIVDLMRNDLGRVAELGSVHVENLLEVESYATVHQLVSTVTAQLAQGKSSIDVLTAAFPAGSMTGAPKISAVRILNELEVGPRGIYSGVFGYFSLDGSSDLAMVIRSAVIADNRVFCGTGGGITSGSNATAEWHETLLKAEALVNILTP